MEREILFRGKRIYNGEWAYGHFCEFPCDDGTDIPSILRIENKENDRIIMQYPIISETVGRFTGLTDRNGIKIFEGDCLRSIKESGFSIVQPVLFIPQFFYECVYEAKGFDLRNKVFGFYCEDSITKEQLLLTDYVSDAFVVIGNIHDNPELLKGENLKNGKD